MALKGIDVSVHQGKIDWKKVASDGVKFAILRAGYGRELSQKDKCFEENYTGAKAAGIKVGAYWYSYADTVTRGEQEAKTFLEVINGKKFDLPVFFDQEYEKSILRLSSATRTEIVLKFIQTVKASGYDCGLYSSTDFFKNKLLPDKLSGIKVWMAEYGSKLHYTGNVWAWQYSSKGKVSGISGNVDMNYGYFTLDTPAKTTSTKLLRKGDSGSDVKLLQHRLNLVGNQLQEDGIWGIKTDTAVRNFQYKAGLVVDGIVGAKTQNTLIRDAILARGAEIGDYMLKHKWHYKGNGYTAKSTYEATKNLDKPASTCAHFVSWVLQDVGLLKNAKILSHSKAGYGTGAKALVNADQLIGCKVIYPNKKISEYKDQLQPGDILVHDSSIGIWIGGNTIMTARNGQTLNDKNQYVKLLVKSGYEWKRDILAIVRPDV